MNELEEMNEEMNELDLHYTISNKELEATIDDSNKSEWSFLDELELKEKDTFEIDDLENRYYCQLNLYRKRGNLHIFSCIVNDIYNYFDAQYVFYLVWINNANVYTFVQENVKSNSVKDDLGNGYMNGEDIDIMFSGLFRNFPVYYEESTSRSKSIKKLELLPLKLTKSVIGSNGGTMYSLENGEMVGKPVQTIRFMPI